MASIQLQKLLKKNTGALVRNLLQVMGISVSIQDAGGAWVMGQEPQDFSLARYPITLDNEPLGWVVGPETAVAIAALLTHLAERELEKRTLTQETLDRYKEINLLYTISAKIASCLEPEAIARLVLMEARKLINSTSASIMLLTPATNTLDVLAAEGSAMSANLVLGPGQGVAGTVLLTGKGVIINDVQLAPEFIEGPNKISSLICVPLQVEEKIIGVMNLSSEYPVAYTAGDLKLAGALASQAAVSIENARLQGERLERQKIMQELDIARNIQQSLLPSTTPIVQGADVTAFSLPAKQVGGDFYDFIPIADNTLGLVIADVSGKGVPAALFMALSRALMRANSLNDPRVAHAVRQTNRLIMEWASSGLFVTLFYAIMDTVTRTMHYVSAGHNPPFLYRHRTGEIEKLEADGIALGVMEDIELEEKEITLETGDVVVLYTDGVTEATNLQEQDFGEDRLMEFLTTHHELSAQELIAQIQQRVLAFTGEAPQFDDITLMVVKMH